MTAPDRKPLRLAGRLMLGALAGKLLGFVREIEMARLLGAGATVDSFRAGITATLMPIALMQGEIVPSVLIPLHRHWALDGAAPLRFGLLSLMFGLFTIPIMLVVWAWTDAWVDFLVPGFGADAHALTVRFVRVMALAMPASVLVNCFSCVEISVGRSRVAVMRASLQNLAVIGAIAIMAVNGDPLVIGWAFSLAMTLTALVGFVLLARERELTLRGASLGEACFVGGVFLRRVRLLLVQPLSEQGNILLERMLASAAGLGALASIEYARTLTDTALFLISQPIGYVLLSQASGTREETRRRVDALLRPLLALALPASVFLLVFAPDVVAVVLRRGAFADEAAAMTGEAMRGIAVGLWATTLGWLLIRLLNSAGRNRAAAAVLASAYASNALVNLMLAPRLGVMGIGLGEAARGLTLLAAAAVALGCGGLLLRRAAAMSLPAVGLGAAGVAVRHVVGEPLPRLLLGAVIFAVGVAPCLLASAPHLRVRLTAALRSRRLIGAWR